MKLIKYLLFSFLIFATFHFSPLYTGAASKNEVPNENTSIESEEDSYPAEDTRTNSILETEESEAVGEEGANNEKGSKIDSDIDVEIQPTEDEIESKLQEVENEEKPEEPIDSETEELKEIEEEDSVEQNKKEELKVEDSFKFNTYSIKQATMPFKKGDRHNDIIEIKKKLNEIGFGDITVTNFYGNWTETRIKQFQRYYGLPVNGTTNRATLQKLNDVFNSPYQHGKHHKDMVVLKDKLNRIGYGYISKTTLYGSFTLQQVSKFQNDNGLIVNGILDEVTLRKLDEKFSDVPFQQGDRHNKIIDIKKKLNGIGFGGISETTFYGNWTETRVKQFQSYYGLSVNGTADRATLQKLNEVYNSPYQHGKHHKDMVVLKDKLNRIGYGYISKTTLYGSFTLRQVSKFQKDNGLTVNGILDEVTLKKLDEKFDDVPFQRGDRHDKIIDIKKKLNGIGFGSISETTLYGNWTETRVKQFQRYYGLSVNGTADRATLQKLEEVYHSPFQVGKRHNDMKILKDKLNRIGYGYISVTTLYGSFTEKQVSKFQKDHGLTVNGILDEVTLRKLDERFGEIPFQVGDRHKNIVGIKQKLNAIGFGGITETNYYGNWTETRVKQFQTYYGLPINGTTDVLTLQKIDEVYNSPFQRGKRHSEIKVLKKKLNEIGYGYISVTTLFGFFTEKQVKKFQRENELTVNGIVDEVTLERLNLIYNNRTLITYSNYNLTFQKALDIQMAIKNPPPQTDKYRNSTAFISSNYVGLSQSGAIYPGGNVKVRTAPNLTDASHKYTLTPGSKVNILGTVKGDAFQGSTDWYRIEYNNEILYAHTLLVVENAVVATTTTNLNVRRSASGNSHLYGVLPKGTNVNIVGQSGSWYEITYSTWRNATRSDVEYFLNPDNNDDFQHLDLSLSAGATASELDAFLRGKGTLEGMGQAFIEASKKHNVNELYLVSHALLETGHGTSNLATGINVEGTVVYNMFGIEAYDSCPDTCGSNKAFKEGWDTPHKAIVGGAKFIGERYIHNETKQNTLYKMRWNPLAMETTGKFGKQYATDIGWSNKQTTNLRNMYDTLSNPLLRFNFIKYN